MIIAIDAGHYRYTPGKRCDKAIDPNETREWYLNDRMARHVAEALKGYDCTVMRCDDATGETDVSLYERAARANRAGAAAFISIHHNAGVNGGAGGGICVYAAKNASNKSVELQTRVYNETVKATGLRGNRATPLPVENHTVTYNAKMPAILGEFGFMDSKTDVPIILTDKFSQQCAEGIAAALIKTFNIPKKQEEEEMAPRYKTIEDIPAGYRKEAQELVDAGSLKGKNDTVGFDVTEDMLRCMIINHREAKKITERMDKLADEVAGKIVNRILDGIKGGGSNGGT